MLIVHLLSRHRSLGTKEGENWQRKEGEREQENERESDRERESVMRLMLNKYVLKQYHTDKDFDAIPLALDCPYPHYSP